MKLNLLFKITISITLIAFTVSCTKPRVDLKLNLQNGQIFLMSYQADMKMSQKIMGTSVDVIIKMNMDLKFTTSGQDTDSNYLMDVAYQAMNYHMKAQGQLVEFGTDKLSKDTLICKAFQNIKGKSFKIKLSRTGKIIDVTGLDTLMQGLFSDNITDTSKISEITELFNKNFGEESIKNNFGSFFNIYPDKPVSIGDKWNNTSSVVSFFALTINNNYQLIDDKDGMYKIDLQSNMKTDTKNATMEIQGMQMKFDMKGTQTGTIKIDQKTAWITESEIKQKIAGNATMTKTGMPGVGNFSIPYTMESTLKIFVKK